MAEVTYLTDAEIKAFLDDLDKNSDGVIDYNEVENKLDAVHDEIAPHPLPHNLNHDSKEDHERHTFLRTIIGSDARQIPRDDFAARVKEWRIPSLEHDTQAQQDQKAYMRKLSPWRRFRSYWAVHGPEIGFMVLVVGMQLAFGIWQLVKYVTGPQYRAAFGWGVVLAKTCAGALYPTFFFLVLSMSRYTSTILRRSYHISRFINWDLSQTFHIRISIVALVLATLHAIGHLTGSFYHGSRPENEEAVAAVLGPDAVPRPYRAYAGSLPGFTGITALCLFYIMALLSLPQIRRWSYEVFQLAHLLMFPIIGLLMAHGTAHLLQWPMFGYWLAVPTLLVLIERVVRVGLGFHRITATIIILDKETVNVKARIPSERLWKYTAGQYVFLQVPKISAFQWHPFTVSVCVGNEMELHIKTDGNWTSKIRDLVGAEAGNSAQIEIGINGPFGAPAQRFYDFRHTVVVGAGIGVTPFSGILADLQVRDNEAHGGPARLGAAAESSSEKVAPTPTHQAQQKAAARYVDKNRDGAPDGWVKTGDFADDYRRVDFHWTVRERNHLLWLSDLLNEVSQSQAWHAAHDELPHLDIRIQTHVTQKRKEISTHVYRWLLEMHRTEDHPASPLTGLLNPTHFGRPDFVSILDAHYEDMKVYRAKSLQKAAERGDSEGDDARDEELKVGVFFCGTPVVGEILADRCRLLTARGRQEETGIEYHFMTEVFA
jgi:dual oxidase